MPQLITLLASFFSSIWSSLYSFLLLALPFLMSKVVALLGIGLISFVGFDLVFSQLQDLVIAKFGELPESMLQILTMLGFIDGLNIFFSTVTAVVIFKQTIVSNKLIFGKSN